MIERTGNKGRSCLRGFGEEDERANIGGERM